MYKLLSTYKSIDSGRRGPLLSLPLEPEGKAERPTAVRSFRAGRLRHQAAETIDEIETQLKVAEYKVSLLREQLYERDYQLKDVENEVMDYRQRLDLLSRTRDARSRLKFYSKLALTLFVISLTIYGLTNVVIVSPIFGLVGLLASIMLWIMAHVYDGSGDSSTWIS